MRLAAPTGYELALVVPDELLYALAERTAELVAVEEQPLPVVLLAEGDRSRGSQLVQPVAGEGEVCHRPVEVEPR